MILFSASLKSPCSVFRAPELSPTAALCQEQSLPLKITRVKQGVEDGDLQRSLSASITL